MEGYEEIFSKRGKSYHSAMDQFPHARDEEFEAAARYLKKKKNSTLLDIPAGGGYLKKYLSKDVNYLAYDFSGEFDDNHSGVAKCRESTIDLESKVVDEIISLAALHHVTDRHGFFQEMFRVLKPDGQFIIADVVRGSKVDSFLNGFLDRWNSMGHKGKFIESDKDILALEKCGFRVTFESRTFKWNFENESESLEFFRKLFFLDLNPSKEVLKPELEKLGISNVENRFGVDWSLGFLLAIKE